MATLLLGPVVGAIFGGGLFGTIAKGLFSIGASLLTQSVAAALSPTQKIEGPRLSTTDITTSTEGSAIPRMVGRSRMPCQIIWATRFEEEKKVEKSGGKGVKPKVQTTTYVYYGNFAVGLCEGPIAGIGRIWFDGKEIDQTLFDIRAYLGTEAQEADSLIEAKEGDGNAPAYRGLAYVVFERLPLTDWGNRIPQVHVEVFRTVGLAETLIQGVAVIPGNEFLYEPETVVKAGTSALGSGFDLPILGDQVKLTDGVTENRHTLVAATDWAASLDRLQMLLPNIDRVMLVVPWFGDDLRCGVCTVRPKVIATNRVTTPIQWTAAGLTRAAAEVVSTHDGASAYGGTPNDASVIRAIQNLTARGLTVTLCPFIMMDIEHDSGLPDPYGRAEQPAYPWRGRITCHPAAGQPGTVDKTATAASQVATFVGSAAPGDFGGSGTTVTYSGPNEWSYRRFILHCAKLAALAGGVDDFLIGSEMVGLTQVRSSASAYPFVTALKTLAADASTILGSGVKVGYAADWTEFHSHRPGDGSGDVYFNMDPLWSDANIDFIGIDNYLPVADWRDGDTHLDRLAGATSIYDRDYLRGNMEGGELYDWYYANSAARVAQTRTPIVDTAHAEHWVFRQKDIRNWWLSAHRNRPAGVRSGSATDWTPQSKPIVFCEYGCGSVDKGPNQPNVFPDPKSSENAWPYFSNRGRDDAMQRAYIEATLGYWEDENATSSVYGGPMIDLSRSNAWCWDVRPWPSFPEAQSLWGDFANHDRGHWINGKMGLAPASESIASILADHGFADASIDPIPSVVDGVTVPSVTSARAVLESIAPIHHFDAVETGGEIRFFSRLGRFPAAVSADELVLPDGEAPLWLQTRGQETELPDSVSLVFGDPARDDLPGSARANRSGGLSARTVTASPPVIMPETRARAAVETILHEAWIGREKLSATLPPSRLALDPGDIIAFAPAGGRLFRLSGVTDRGPREVAADAADPLHYQPVEIPRSTARAPVAEGFLDPVALFVDGPLLADDDIDHAGYVVGSRAPFRSGVAVFRSPTTSGFVLDTLIEQPATIGYTTADLFTGPVARWDRIGEVHVNVLRGTLVSADETLVLNGENALLLRNQDGEWEVLQFATATLTGPRSYVLSDLLRGQLGTEHAMRDPVPAGAPVVLVNSAILQPGFAASALGLPLNWRYGPAERDYSDPSYTALTFTFTGKGRRPLSPVHLRADKEEDGDFALSWIRRTRIGGDSWDQVEVPLGEESERYEVEILNGAGTTVLRTVTGLTTPAYTYSSALQTTDFGSPQTSLKWRVYQMSATYGRGIPGIYPQP